MNRKFLIVFVDSFPYERLTVTQFVRSLPTQIRLIPTLGYSINLLPELFAGQQPDDVGFFGEWTYDPENSPFQHKELGEVLQFATRAGYYVDRALHKILSNVLDVHLAQIPFDLLPYFSHHGHSIYEDEMWSQSLFAAVDTVFRIIRSEQFRKAKGERDKRALELAQANLSSSLFVSLVDLDSVGHKYGVDSPEHNNYIKFLDNEIQKLWQKFRETNQEDECVLFVLSDHGMSNVHSSVKVNLESDFGRPHPHSYVYFADSTILRIWTDQPSLKEEIQAQLERRQDGHVLTEIERQRLGVKSHYCGDILFCLEEGYIFSPSFHGLRVPAGMHGYHPKTPSQHALLVSSDETVSHKTMIHSRSVFNLLVSAMGRKGM